MIGVSLSGTSVDVSSFHLFPDPNGEHVRQYFLLERTLCLSSITTLLGNDELHFLQDGMDGY